HCFVLYSYFSSVHLLFVSLVPSLFLHLLFFSRLPPPPPSSLFPYTTLFRSLRRRGAQHLHEVMHLRRCAVDCGDGHRVRERPSRSEEHTSELQSRFDLVCRLLLEKKKNT